MKAWLCETKGEPKAQTVIFALSRRAAKMIAYTSATFRCGVNFSELRVRRIPELDHQCFGRDEMDWENDEDRILMVRYAGMFCRDPKKNKCRACPANPECRMWAVIKSM